MSTIILFSNIKGGVGKTTLCANFAEYLSMKGISVVAVDADLQAYCEEIFSFPYCSA